MKAKKVSFANPLISAMWSSGVGEGSAVADCSRLTNVHLPGNKTPVAAEGNSSPIDDNGRDNSMALLLSQASASPKIARLFSRPLTKEQMEAIMELVNQGVEKTGHKRRGRKVTPIASPTIRAVGDA